MAITYLSGQRIQGVSANSSSSWTSNTADWSYSSSGYLDFATIHRATTSQEIYLDLQDFLGGSNLSDSSWVVRLGKFTTGALASSGNVLLYIGFTNNNGADSGETQQTIVTAFNFNPSAGAINVIGTADSIESGDEAGTVYSDLDASTDYYVEMKRDGNDFTVTAYSDEYSTSLGTQTITKSGLSGLRYFKAFNNSEQSGNSATGSKFYGDVQIYDAQTSATTLTKTITLADDKTTVTSVPVGSQFEETNTRKFYQLASGGAVKFDSQSYANTASNGTTLTTSITVGDNDNRILIVSAGSYNLSPTISGVTFGSQNFTAIDDDIIGSDGRSYLWYLLAPTVGTDTITVTWSGTAGRKGIGGMSFYNAKQTAPVNANTESSTSGTTAGGDVTPTTAGSAIVDGMFDISGSSSRTGNLTAGWTQFIGGNDRGQSSQYSLNPTINSANTMEYTLGSGAGWAWVGCEIKCEDASLGNEWVERGTAT